MSQKGKCELGAFPSTGLKRINQATQHIVSSVDGGIGLNNPPVNRVEEVEVANQTTIKQIVILP